MSVRTSKGCISLLWYSKFHDGLVELKREEVPQRVTTK
jgi:hypothetical protein